MLFIMPLIALSVIIVPLVLLWKKKHDGKEINMKKSFRTNLASFVGCLALMLLVMPTIASAESAEAVTAAADSGLAEGLKYLSAALTTGIATIACGLAVGKIAPAAIGATSENDKNFTKSLIFVALGEGVAIYGLLISILILNA